ncbi:hypothetical protein EAX62_03630 [Tessaracoccus antarcticus]|uniref:Uncharacterized protein n=1 Tax=Tessaracoccus antarcticus TaxID=2479848 RepID=A0A3M0GWJ7_9ACTN|nr:hypothetical protein EAX62_03630 [Tessaracoccus antarcticus]
MQTAATIMAASVFLLPVALGKVAELILKSTNPDDIDVTVPLAYLRTLLVVSFSLTGIWLVVAVATLVVLQRREGTAAARNAWLVLGVQVVLGVLFLVLQGVLNGVNDGG